MTKLEAAKQRVINLLKELQNEGFLVEITSDYGSDSRIEIETQPWVSFQDSYTAVRWYDIND